MSDSEFEEEYNKNVMQPAKIPKCICNKHIPAVIQKYSICTQKIGFTLTFNKNYHEIDSDILYNFLLKFIKQYFGSEIEYIIAPEYTDKGVIHFHGIIYNCYQRYINRILNKWRDQYGFIKMEYKISPKWEEYIIKDMDAVGYPIVTNI